MSRFANLSRRLEGLADHNPEEPETPAPEKTDEPEGEPASNNETGDSSMTTETPLEQREDYKAGLAAGTELANAASARMTTVFAHADAKGREAHAARLLGTSMSADEIIAELPNYPVASVLSKEEQQAAAEEGGRQEMREQMNNAGNADLGADAGGEPQSKRQKADAVWDRANAAVGRTKKEG